MSYCGATWPSWDWFDIGSCLFFTGQWWITEAGSFSGAFLTVGVIAFQIYIFHKAHLELVGQKRDEAFTGKLEHANSTVSFLSSELQRIYLVINDIGATYQRGDLSSISVLQKTAYALRFDVTASMQTLLWMDLVYFADMNLNTTALCKALLTHINAWESLISNLEDDSLDLNDRQKKHADNVMRIGESFEAFMLEKAIYVTIVHAIIKSIHAKTGS